MQQQENGALGKKVTFHPSIRKFVVGLYHKQNKLEERLSHSAGVEFDSQSLYTTLFL